MAKALLALADFHAHLAAGRRASVGVRLAPSNNVQETKEADRTATFIFSDDSVDSYGDTIDARGWDLKSFEANPVALFGHDPSKPEYVIGKARNVRIEGRSLIGEIEFAGATVNPTAETVFQMVKAGYLNAVSVGFMPLEWSFTKDKARPGGIDFKKQKLLEISVVAIPANENALVQARAAGLDVDRLAFEQTRQAPKLTAKNLYDVSWLAGILSDLGYVQDLAAWEAEYEGDSSPVPQMLAEALNLLGAALIAMTVEEVGELLADRVDPPPVSIDALVSMSNDAEFRRSTFAMLRRLDFGALLAMRSAMAGHLSGRRIAFTDKGVETPLTRAGRVLSAANEKAIREAHTMFTDGCGLLKAVVDQVATDAADDTVEASAEAEARARGIRERRARAAGYLKGL